MRRIYASTSTAQVVNLQPRWDFLYEQFVSETVSHWKVPSPIKSAIAVVGSRKPQPTAGGLKNFPPESMRQACIAKRRDAKLSLHRKVTPFVSVPANRALPP